MYSYSNESRTQQISILFIIPGHSKLNAICKFTDNHCLFGRHPNRETVDGLCQKWGKDGVWSRFEEKKPIETIKFIQKERGNRIKMSCTCTYLCHSRGIYFSFEFSMSSKTVKRSTLKC